MRYRPVLRLTIPDGEMEFGVQGVPGEAEEAGVAGGEGVTGVARAGGGDRGVGTALNTSSFWKNKIKSRNYRLTLLIIIICPEQ